MRGAIVILAVSIALLIAIPGNAFGAQLGEVDLTAEPSGEYCGVYALYTALRIEGRPTKFTNLLRPEYVGSRQGSSLAELRRAAIDFRVNVAGLQNLDPASLVSCPYLAVLHVKSPADSPEYNHFVLFLGMHSGRIMIYDAPKPVAELSPVQLASQWDGSALLISKSPISVNRIEVASVRGPVMWTLLAVIMVLVVHSAGRWLRSELGYRPRNSFGRTLLQSGGIILAATMGGFGYHFCSAGGLLAAGEAIRATESANLMSLTPTVTAEEVRSMVGTDVVFIDARLAADFERGHIPGAISVPVDADLEQRRQAMSAVPKSAKLVVYCESPLCPYSEAVVRRLETEGYGRVYVYRGGWEEWSGS